MKQEITIDGLSIAYSIEEKNIRAVMGQGHIYRPLTYNDMINIIYRGLQRTCGYTADEFLNAVLKGQIYTSKGRNQYSLSVIRRRIRERIFDANRNYAIAQSKLT